jgi:hypothetical protein
MKNVAGTAYLILLLYFSMIFLHSIEKSLFTKAMRNVAKTNSDSLNVPLQPVFTVIMNWMLRQVMKLQSSGQLKIYPKLLCSLDTWGLKEYKIEGLHEVKLAGRLEVLPAF